jgi:hypothetical protein
VLLKNLISYFLFSTVAAVSIDVVLRFVYLTTCSAVLRSRSYHSTACTVIFDILFVVVYVYVHVVVVVVVWLF